MTLSSCGMIASVPSETVWTTVDHPSLGRGQAFNCHCSVHVKAIGWIGMNRLRRALRRHGIAKTLILAVRLSMQHLFMAVYQHERHVWFAGAPESITARSLPTGLILYRSGRADLDLLSESNLWGRSVGERFLEGGGELWIVRDKERAAFCCWIFRERMPTIVVRSGWKRLPPKTICLEEPVTDVDYRGRGIAAAAWFLIAQSLKREGIRAIIMKVKEHNMPMRRAVLRAGLHEVALMDYLHALGLSRVQVIPSGEILQRDREILREMKKMAA